MEKSKLVENMHLFGSHIRLLIKEERLSTRCLFSNGNIELFLKSLFFDFIELKRKNGTYSYCMDKRINKHQIDAIGFIGLEVSHTVESKCTLADDVISSIKASEKAIEQSLKNSERVIHKDYNYKNNVEHHIIHFLILENGRESEFFPEPIQKKFPKKKDRNAIHYLSEIYGIIDSSAHQEIPIIKNRLSAFVVKVF